MSTGARPWLARAGRDPLVWATFALALLYLALVVARPPRIFWSLDEGGKFIYLQNVLQTHDPGAPLVYPGRSIDPQLKFVPLYFWVRQGDQIYSWWAVGFPLLTLPFYAALGWTGLYVLPIVAGALSAGLAGVLVRQLVPGPGWLATGAALVTGLATPVAFYSTTFWEHTASAACLLGAVACVLRALASERTRWLALAGALAAATTFLRNESLLLVAGLGLALLIWRWRRAVIFGVCYGLSCLPWMALNWLWMGNPFSRYFGQIADGPAVGGIREAGLSFIPYFLFNAPRVMAFALPSGVLVAGSAAVVVAVLAFLVPAWRWLSVLACAALVAVSAYVSIQPYGYRSVHGFVLIAPQVMLAVWLYGARPRSLPAFFGLAVLAMSLVYGSVYLLRGWLAAGGLQWGPRYLLSFYPLYIVAGLAGLALHWPQIARILRIAAVTTYALGALVAVGYEARGASALFQTVQSFDRARAAIQSLPAETLVTRCTWLGMVIPDVYATQRLFAVPDQAAFEAWSAEAGQAGVKSGYRIDMDACQTTGLDEVSRLAALNPSGLTAEPFLLP